MQFHCGFRSDLGRRRVENQDNGIALPDLGLFIVADGMGGHQGGETASRLAIETITEHVKQAIKKVRWNPRRVITDAVQAANRRIFLEAQENARLQGMGTTATCLLFKEGTLFVGHVGDSRCYFFRPNSMWQLTRDHSLVQEKLRIGMITREQARIDQMKNVITRSVGFEPLVNVDVYEFQVQVGDLLLMCSDGLTGMVEDQEILEIVQKNLFDGREMETAVDDLIDVANNKGGEDNITVLITQVLSA